MIVELNANGGILQASTGIGRDIRYFGFETVVLRGSVCVSGCAYAWLGGTKRMVDYESHIGFHRSALSPAGDPETGQGIIERLDNSQGDALLRQYMEQLKIPPQVIERALSVGPSEVVWFWPDWGLEHFGPFKGSLKLSDDDWRIISTIRDIRYDDYWRRHDALAEQRYKDWQALRALTR